MPSWSRRADASFGPISASALRTPAVRGSLLRAPRRDRSVDRVTREERPRSPAGGTRLPNAPYQCTDSRPPSSPTAHRLSGPTTRARSSSFIRSLCLPSLHGSLSRPGPSSLVSNDCLHSFLNLPRSYREAPPGGAPFLSSSSPVTDATPCLPRAPSRPCHQLLLSSRQHASPGGENRTRRSLSPGGPTRSCTLSIVAVPSAVVVVLPLSQSAGRARGPRTPRLASLVVPIELRHLRLDIFSSPLRSPPPMLEPVGPVPRLLHSRALGATASLFSLAPPARRSHQTSPTDRDRTSPNFLPQPANFRSGPSVHR